MKPRHRHDPRPPKPATPTKPTRASDERDIVYGLRAAIAVLETRPSDVLRVGVARDASSEIDPALRRLDRSVPVLELDEREIHRITQSPQHEGICVETRARAWASSKDLEAKLTGVAGRPGVAIALDRVRNAYNIGAILRSAAFFGVDAVLLGTPAPHPGLDANAVRVAEGGAEHVMLARTTDLADTLSRLRARGVFVVGTDGAADTDALSYPFAAPAIVVLGNEREGLGPRVRAACDAVVAIRGSGTVESLNVGVAAGVLIAKLVGARAS